MALRDLLLRIRSQFDNSGTEEAKSELEDVAVVSSVTTESIVAGWQAAAASIGAALAILEDFLVAQDAAAGSTVDIGAQAAALGVSTREFQALSAVGAAAGIDSQDLFGILEGLEAQIVGGSDDALRAASAVGLDIDQYLAQGTIGRFRQLRQASAANQGNVAAREAFGALVGGEDAGRVLALGGLADEISFDAAYARVPGISEADLEGSQGAAFEAAIAAARQQIIDADRGIHAAVHRGLVGDLPFGIPNPFTIGADIGTRVSVSLDGRQAATVSENEHNVGNATPAEMRP